MNLRLHTAVEHVETPAPDAPPPQHTELVDRLLARAPEEPDAPAPDLVALVYAVPDPQGHKTTASYLNHRTGGAAHGFALTDQGVGGPFTALRVADAYARTGRCSAPMVAVVESGGTAGATAASGVLLRLDGRTGFGLADTATVPVARLAEAWAELVPERGRLLLVLGPGTDPGAAPAERTDVRAAPTDSSCTAVWRLLAREAESWRGRYATVALCAVDPATGTGHLAVLRDLDACEPPAGDTEEEGARHG
ncbi:hypothetical protein [Streptomyces sp. NBC_00996]|uniref:hypothetical protein n=1 Tax=Streptomyces sp. NBC_00996 TaxID=2903710 RepID=UPI00386D85D4|nr:hypothetical protein OG390_15075 [Streptomyces sp. NBC_00996]